MCRAVLSTVEWISQTQVKLDLGKSESGKSQEVRSEQRPLMDPWIQVHICVFFCLVMQKCKNVLFKTFYFYYSPKC